MGETMNERRVFIGGVGYTNLRDLSVGPIVLPALARLEWPRGVEVDDLSLGGPIAAVHRFREAPPYARVVLFGGVGRGREPGLVYAYRWDGALPARDVIQGCVAEAVTGIISLDNLLIVGGFFGIWPREVVVLEVEPRDDSWGPELSAPVRAALAPLMAAISWAALVPALALPASPDAVWDQRAAVRSSP